MKVLNIKKIKAQLTRLKIELKGNKMYKPYKLKPCPFCGSNALMGELKQGKFPRYFVKCANSSCLASENSCFGKKYYSEQEAAEMWNMRKEV